MTQASGEQRNRGMAAWWFAFLILLSSQSSIALGAGPGTIKWSYPIDEGCATPAIGHNGTIYVPSGNQLLAINPNGTLKWSFDTEIADMYVGIPSVDSQDNIYFVVSGSSPSYIYALSSNKNLLWKKELLSGGFSSSCGEVAISPDSTIYASGSSRIQAFDPTGQSKWIAHGGQLAPAISQSGNIIVIDWLDISPIFELNKMDGEIYRSSYPTRIYVGHPMPPAMGINGDIYITGDGSLVAFRNNLTQSWRNISGYTVEPPVIDVDGTIYYMSRDDGYYFDAVKMNGTRKFKFTYYPPNTTVVGTPAIGNNGYIYIPSAYEGLVAFSNTGDVQWHTGGAFKNSSTPAIIGPDGTIYLIGYVQEEVPIGQPIPIHYSLYAIQSSSTGPAPSAWPMYGANAQHTHVVGNFKLTDPPTLTFGPPGGPANPSGFAAEPVNTATGNYYYQHADLTLPGRGLGFAFTRTYNAQDTADGPFGRGWTHRYHVRLTENPDGSVTVRHGDGRETFFDPNGDDSYSSHYPGVHDALVKTAAATFQLTAKDQTRHTFTDGRLTRLSDRNGNALNFAYDAAGQLTTITDTAGRAITLGYDANGRLTQLGGPLGSTVQYAYNASGDLAADTDPEGGIQQYTYDGDRRLTRITNRRGQILVDNVYDEANRVTAQTNGRGLVTTFAYDSPYAGDTTITDPLGRATIHRHDGQRRLIADFNPLGLATVQYAYDTRNNRTLVVDGNGLGTTYTYDTRGNVLTQTDPLDHVTTLTYGANDNPLTRTDALGQTTTFSYDAQGNVLSETNPLGQTTRYTYDSYGQRLTRTDGNGHITHYAYDAQGNRTAVTNPLNQTTAFAYDAAGRLIRGTDANGHATIFSHDGNDRLLTISDPINHTVAHAYDADGNRTQVTDPKGQTTVTAYDANDNVLSVTDPTGAVTTYSYDAADQRLTLADPRGHVTAYGYDAAGRLTRVTNALGQTTTYNYDNQGNRLGATNPLGQTVRYQYDSLNRLTRVADPLGNATTYQYDALGRRAVMTDARGGITSYGYDALGRLTQVTDPANGVSTATYDAAGNRTSLTNPNGHATVYQYDAADRRTLEANALNQFTAWQYDAAGNPVQRTDAKGQVTQYSYDAADRLAGIHYPDATTVAFGRDANGNLTQMVDPLGTTTYAYDPRNRLIDQTDPYGATVNHDYDAAGNRTLLIYPDGKEVHYAYDPLDRLASVTDWRGASTDYSYDAAGNLIGAINHGNSTQTLYGYDIANRLGSVIDQRTDNTIFALYNLAVDAVGNRTAIASQDPVAPLFVSQNTPAAHDAAERLTTLGASPVTHDANGNLLGQPGGSYQYDGDDRLTAANGQSYAYDGQGHRLTAIRNGATTRYVHDLAAPLSQVLMERDSAGNPMAYYVHGLGLIARIAANGNDARYYHYDAGGNTVALTDAAGQITDAYAYGPFGELLAQQGSTANPFRFLGQFGVMHEGDGLHYVRARYYHPATGRFLSKDPVRGTPEAGQTLNPYAYALNNPVRFVDINGLSAREGSGASNAYGPSDELHVSYIGGRCDASDGYVGGYCGARSDQAYRRKIRWQQAEFAAEAARQNEKIARLNQWINPLEGYKKGVKWVMRGSELAGLMNPAFELPPAIYDIGTTTVDTSVVLYRQVKTGQINTGEALKIVTQKTIGLVTDKLGNMVSDPLSKGIIKIEGWVHEDIADWTIGEIFE